MSAVPIYQHQASGAGIYGEHETVWLSQEQRSPIFGRDRTVISCHIKTLFQDGNLARKSNVQKVHVAAAADRPRATFYDVNVAISVSYHVKFREGPRF